MKSKKRRLRVGLIKFVPKKWNLAYNWKHFENLTLEAADQGAKLVCTIECMLDGYVPVDKRGFTRKKFRTISQSLDGDNYLARARELAQRLGIHIIFGFTERAEKGSYNSAAFLDHRGKLLGCYHKTHLPAHDKAFLRGMEYPVWKTSLGKIGILICADRWWPESARSLLVQGAELIMIPTYGSWDLKNEWAMRTRSIENECFICHVNPHVAFITDPKGELVAKLQNNIPDVLVHDIDLSEVNDFRMRLRRPDIYKTR